MEVDASRAVEGERPGPVHFGPVIERNIRSLVEIRRRDERHKSFEDRAADSITRFAGSMTFVYLHLAWIGGWVLVNLGVVGLRPFDPFPFGLLTMIGSLEAIFLSTFVLISQNRMAAKAEQRAELDLQVSLLSEHEITRLIRLTDAVAEHLGVQRPDPEDLEESERDVDPGAVLRAIEAQEGAPGS